MWRGFRDTPFCILLLSRLTHRKNQALFFRFRASEFLCPGSGNSASSLWLFVPRHYVPAVRLSQRLRRALPAHSKAILILISSGASGASLFTLDDARTKTSWSGWRGSRSEAIHLLDAVDFDLWKLCFPNDFAKQSLVSILLPNSSPPEASLMRYPDRPKRTRRNRGKHGEFCDHEMQKAQQHGQHSEVTEPCVQGAENA